MQRIKELGILTIACNEMDQDSINIIGIRESNWINKGNIRTHDNKLVIFTGEDDGEG